ncbi:hypothetical protein [Helicobacter sp. UBA3407]|uniref:hypothetical protein n=1 Tax=Helicobacter TaxID=209 RepID=UPI002614F865|nr:hypothetical protein [Helicobacter sp. UBA3407]
MFSLKALSPNLIQKSCFLTFSALLLGACAQKFNDLPNTRVLKTCQEPIASYHLMGLKSGDYNDLTIPNTQVQQMVAKSLAQSGCFIQSEQISTETTNTQKNHYQLEVVFGNINTQTKQGGFWSSQTSDQAVFEVQLNFHRTNEVRIFRGKSSIQNQNSQYLVIFGEKSKLNPNQIQITIQNAINSAINEATRNLIQEVQNKDSTNYSNF